MNLLCHMTVEMALSTVILCYVKGQLDKDKAAGRFQLQSFQIERTHWHYMLDTATGQLFRLEPSRTPGNSKWVLTADANFK